MNFVSQSVILLPNSLSLCFGDSKRFFQSFAVFVFLLQSPDFMLYSWVLLPYFLCVMFDFFLCFLQDVSSFVSEWFLSLQRKYFVNLCWREWCSAVKMQFKWLPWNSWSMKDGRAGDVWDQTHLREEKIRGTFLSYFGKSLDVTNMEHFNMFTLNLLIIVVVIYYYYYCYCYF